MKDNIKKVIKLISNSAILSIGSIIVAVSLFLYKVIFYQESPASYSEFLLAYSVYLFYRIIGFMDVGNPLSNDVNKFKENYEDQDSKYLGSAFNLVLAFSLFSNLIMIVNLFLIEINWRIILIFCFAMFSENINNVIITYFRGLEKVTSSSILLSIKGASKPLLLFIYSFLFEINSLSLTAVLLVAELFALIVSFVAFLIYYRKNKLGFNIIKADKRQFIIYILQCLTLMIISLTIQGFRSSMYMFIDHYLSSENLGFLDVPITLQLFLLTFFINIGLMLTVNNEDFKEKRKFLKFIGFIFLTCTLLVILYEIIAYFITTDDLILEYVFNLEGMQLAEGVMLLLPSVPFFVIFYITSGYKQGSRKYLGLTLMALISLIISILPAYFLIRHLGLTGAFIAQIIYSIILAALSIVIIVTDKIDTYLEILYKKIKIFILNKINHKNKDDLSNIEI